MLNLKTQQLDLKLAFAKLLLKTPDDPFKAALALLPAKEDLSTALKIAHEWPVDPDVIAARDGALKDDGPLSFLPTKAEACRHIWDKATKGIMEPDEYTRMMKLYCDTMGFIEKPQTTVQNNVQNVQSNVMVIKDGGSDEDWETGLRKQQETLLNVSTS